MKRKKKDKDNIYKTTVVKIGIKKFFRYQEHINYIQKHTQNTTQVLYEFTLFINYYVIRAIEQNKHIINLSELTNLNRIRYLCENRSQKEIVKVLAKLNNPFLKECWTLWKEQRKKTLLFGDKLDSSIGNAYSKNTITMYSNFFMMRYSSFMLKYARYLFRHSDCHGFTGKQLSYVAKRMIQQFMFDKNVLPTFYNERLKNLVQSNIETLNSIHTELLKYLPTEHTNPLNEFIISKHWTDYITPWYKLLKVFENQNNQTEHDYKFTLHNILPMYSLDAKYIPFTKPMLYSIHNKIANGKDGYVKRKKFKPIKGQTSYNANFYNYASMVFRLKHVETTKTKFIGPILTNGDFVSVTMEKSYTTNPLKNKQSKLNLDDKHVIAVDPGIKNIIYSVDKDGTTCKVTNKEYYHLLKNKKRQRKRENIYKHNMIYNSLLQMTSSKTCILNNYKRFLSDVYKHLHKWLNINCSNVVKKINKDAYIAKQRAYTKIMSKFNNIYSSNENKKKVIAFGNGSFQSSMKGYTSSTYKTFKDKLKVGNVLEEVDEYKTSQICYHCHKEELGYIKKKGIDQHHVRVCNNKHCRMTVLDRDLVGAKNILTVYVHSNEHGQVPYCFRRSTKCHLSSVDSNDTILA